MVPAFDKKSYVSTWQCEQYEKQGQALYFTMQWCTDPKYTVNHIAQAHFHNFLSRITEEQHMTCAEWPVCIST